MSLSRKGASWNHAFACILGIPIAFVGCGAPASPAVVPPTITVPAPVAEFKPPPPPDPLADFRPILKEIAARAENGIGIVDNSIKGDFSHVEWRFSEPKVDVRKTDSLVSPFVATVSTTCLFRISRKFTSKAEAAAAEIPPNVMSAAKAAKSKGAVAELDVDGWKVHFAFSDASHSATFHYVENRWTLGSGADFPITKHHASDAAAWATRIYIHLLRNDRGWHGIRPHLLFLERSAFRHIGRISLGRVM